MKLWISTGIVWTALACSLSAQQGPRMLTPLGSVPPPHPPASTQPAKEETKEVKQTVPAKESANAKQPAGANDAKKAEQKQEQTAAPAPAVTKPAGPVAVSKMSGGFTLSLTNASLTQVIDVLARHLRMNYILDPRVKGGGVTLNTYGELKAVDVRALLDTVLRMNGAAIVEMGDLYRIVPLAQISRMPIPVEVDSKKIPDDERVVLNLVFLKYATVAEMSKILEKFLGEGAEMVTYDPANLLLIMDNNRSMRRTMEIISMFDSDALASQRVRLFEVKHSRPSDLANELDTVLKSVSLTGKVAGVRFLALDRINTLIAVAPNPGVFEEVAKWLDKLDVEVKIAAGATDNYVYRVKYGRAQLLAMAIMQLYFGNSMMGYGGYGMMGMGMYSGMGYGGYGYGSSTSSRRWNKNSSSSSAYSGISPYGYSGYGAGYGGYGMGYGGYGMGYGGYGMGYGAYGAANTLPTAPATTGTTGTTGQQTAGTTSSLTGTYLGASSGYGGMPADMPTVVPNPMDNTLLIQATPQQYQKVLRLLRDLDVAPRQVLIEAKIYQVTLTGSFSGGVEAYLQRLDSSSRVSIDRLAQASSSSSGLGATAGLLIGHSRELVAAITAAETENKSKLISSPSIIVTDSISANITVGSEVPTLSSTALTGASSSGTSIYTNSVSYRETGVVLDITAYVSPGGNVTLEINQEVSSSHDASSSSSIQSPTISEQSIQTQVTVQDGDTIGIGGIIQQSDTANSSGIPFLHRVPGIGMLFGAKSTSKERTELVMFFTPHVIYDTSQITEATDELRTQFKRISKLVKE